MKVNLEMLRDYIEMAKTLKENEKITTYNIYSYLNIFLPYILANENIAFYHNGVEYNINSTESFIDFAQHALRIPLK